MGVQTSALDRILLIVAELSTGTLTLLFSKIEGPTALLTATVCAARRRLMG